MNPTKGRIDIISMGCSKNLVDSERLMRRLKAKGYHTVHDAENPSGEIVVVNTCGFIADAQEESINLILQLSELRKKRQIGKLIVMGCLSERFRTELQAEISEVDEWYGKFNWIEIIDRLPDLKEPDTVKSWERTLTTPEWSTFLKISEGCNRFCAFCAIPLITGRHKSRPVEEIIDEVRALVSEGVKEFNVIAQDLSSYGLDLYGRSALAELIDKMAQIEGVEWIRLHYAYPADFPMDLLPVMAKHDNICKYLDIALQHISDPVLDNMKRHITGDETRALLKEIRRQVPDINIRTTLMVGFPGEGEKEFEELLDFVREQRFERMGAFAYCEESDTTAAKTLDDNITEDTKQERLDILMSLQQEIAEETNASLIGKKMRVLIEDYDGDMAIGRTEFDSPEVDQTVYVKNCHAHPGDFVEIMVTGSLPFELIGEVVNAKQQPS